MAWATPSGGLPTISVTRSVWSDLQVLLSAVAAVPRVTPRCRRARRCARRRRSGEGTRLTSSNGLYQNPANPNERRARPPRRAHPPCPDLRQGRTGPLVRRRSAVVFLALSLLTA